MAAAALALAVACAQWASPLAFAPVAGWKTGKSGTFSSIRGEPLLTPESTAWTATAGVRYRDPASSDPPNRTLAHLPRNAIVVYGVIWPTGRFRPGTKAGRLDLRRARHLACCEGAFVASGDWEVAARGPADAYTVVVRVFFGSRHGEAPTSARRALAQRAIDALRLPAPRRCRPR